MLQLKEILDTLELRKGIQLVTLKQRLLNRRLLSFSHLERF